MDFCSMELIDTHCHLYLEDFDSDLSDVMKRAATEQVKKFYLPAIDSSTHTAMIGLEEKYNGQCFAMMGLHPCSVKENYKEELQIADEWLNRRKFAAVGEIGLDFYWDKTFTKEQYTAFHTQIEWALNYKLPIVIHTRNAMPETIDVVKQYEGRGLTGIFHCFGGTVEEAQQITSIGFYLGIGGVLTYKKSGLDETLKEVDLKHIVLETDSPYLTPVPFRGKRNESSYLQYVVQRLAQVKKISIEEIAAVTTANAEKIFMQ